MFRLYTVLTILLLLPSLLSGCSSAFKPGAKTPSAVAVPEGPKPVISPKTVSAQPLTRIALLLPLSGPSQDVGRAMLDAAQLALFSANEPGITLMPIDTESKDDKVAASTRQAIDQGAKIIIGPVFSRTTSVVARTAKPYAVNVLSFSNDKTLAGNGVFLLGFMADEQIKRVTSYAVGQGITDFYALVPSDTYGNLALTSLRQAAVEGNGTIIKTEFYSPKGNDLALSVRNIAESLKHSSSSTPKALFIPEGGEKLRTITRLLAEQNIDKSTVRLIGTGQWDDAATIQNSYLSGAWFAGTPLEQHKLFDTNFQQYYGYKPLRIASLAYDAMALVCNVAAQSQGTNFSREMLTNPRGFVGTDGIFRLQPNGITERKLAVLSIDNGTVNIIDPSPQGFEN